MENQNGNGLGYRKNGSKAVPSPRVWERHALTRKMGMEMEWFNGHTRINTYRIT